MLSLDEEVMGSRFARSKNPTSWISTARSKIAAWISPPSAAAAAPVHAVRPAYKDTTQIAISCEQTFMPTVFGESGFDVEMSKNGEREKIRIGSGPEATQALRHRMDAGWEIVCINSLRSSLALPTATGRVRIYESFKPTRVIIDETVAATYAGSGLPDRTIYEQVDTASDILLISAFSGARNCFPNAPCEDNGISGQVFAWSSTGSGISWPTINGGIDLCATFAIKPTVLSRATGRCRGCGSDGNLLPREYDPIPKMVTVSVRMNLLGPSLR